MGVCWSSGHGASCGANPMFFMPNSSNTAAIRGMLAANTHASKGENSKNRAKRSVDRMWADAAPVTMARMGRRLKLMPNLMRNSPENTPDKTPAKLTNAVPAIPSNPASGISSVDAHTPKGSR